MNRHQRRANAAHHRRERRANINAVLRDDDLARAVFAEVIDQSAGGVIKLPPEWVDRFRSLMGFTPVPPPASDAAE